MKYIYLLTIASTILLTGCDKNELESLPKNNPNAIEVTLNAAYGEKATKTSINGNTVSWKLGDKLGLYTKGTGANNNVPFDLNPLDEGKTSGSFFGALTAFTGSIYSYYPYNANSGTDATQVPVEIPVDGAQTYNGDYNSLGDFDAFNNYSYMVSAPVENQKLSNNVPVAIAPILNYEHVTTVLNFKLTSNATKSLTINNIKLSCTENPVFIKSGTLNLTEMNIEKRLQVNNPVKVDHIQVTLPQAETQKLVIDPKATKIVRMVLFPAKLSGLTITFTINATIAGITTPVDLIVTKSGMDLLRGMSYDVPVTIDVVDTPQAAQSALSNGAETVVITQPIAESQLSIPKAENSSKPNNISISAPITGTVTIQQEEGANSKISLVNTASVSGTSAGSAVVICPTGTVNITGNFNEITATTAENTLIVEAGTTIEKLTVHKGNVKIYGTVKDVIESIGYNGTVTTYVKDCNDLIGRIKERNDNTGVKTIALLGGKEFIITEDISISAPLTILSDNIGNPAILKLENTKTITCIGTPSNVVTFKNLEIIGATKTGTGVINATGNVNLTIDGCKIIQNTEGNGDGTATMAIGINLTNSNNNLTVNHSAIHLKKNYQMGICAYTNGGIASITFNNSQITTDNAGIPKTYNRGINIGDMNFGTRQPALLMDNSTIEGVYYPINVTNTAAPFENASIEVKNSKLDGRCGFNVWKGGVLFNIANTTMIGRNYYGGPTECFGDVVLNSSATNTTLNFTNCIFKTERNPSTTNNLQFILDIRSTNNTINFSGNNRIIDNSTMNYFIDCGSSDKITGVNTITIESNRPGTSVLLEKNIWDGKMVAPVAYKDNYTIYTAAELAWVADQVTYQKNTFFGKTITLCNDLDLNQLPWTPIGCAEKHSATVSGIPKNLFMGEFNGQDYTISNLNIEIETDAKGLFGAIKGGSLKNIKITNAAVPATAKAGKWVGGLVGYFQATSNKNVIENCHIDGVVINAPDMYRIGGLVGFWASGVQSTITNSTVKNAVLTGGFAIGGIVGSVQGNGVKISTCTADNIEIRHSKQYCWQTDPTYPNYAKETGGYIYASSPVVGDLSNVWLNNITIVDNWKIIDLDGHDVTNYNKATWTKLPYAGEIGNLYMNDNTTKETADVSPKHNGKFSFIAIPKN